MVGPREQVEADGEAAQFVGRWFELAPLGYGFNTPLIICPGLRPDAPGTAASFPGEWEALLRNRNPSHRVPGDARAHDLPRSFDQTIRSAAHPKHLLPVSGLDQTASSPLKLRTCQNWRKNDTAGTFGI